MLKVDGADIKVDNADLTQPQSQPEPVIRVVAIGSSAGGLEALQATLASIPEDSPFCYLIAQHVSPSHQSMLQELLSRGAKHLDFKECKTGMSPCARTVFITPPNHDLLVRNKKLVLTAPEHVIGPKPSVDALFTSVAQEYGEQAIGVILSGTGSDGTHGARALRAHGGLAIAQEPVSAKYDGMPSSAIHSGNVDLVLRPEAIGPYLANVSHGLAKPKASEVTQSGTMYDLLRLVEGAHGINFAEYKVSTISRQISRRIEATQTESIENYLKFAQQDAIEVHRLFTSFLISVTSFFRDADYWEALKKPLAERLKLCPPNKTFRAWIPGCATGQEAYTAAMLISDLINESGNVRQFKIFATDIDETALEVARRGVYPEVEVESQIESSIRSRYFSHEGRFYKVSKQLRDSIVFSRHNLAGDPAFHGLDLISCRNVFIYLIPAVQAHLQSVFHNALSDGGILMLGKSEGVDNADSFRPLDLPRGLYASFGSRKPALGVQRRIATMTSGAGQVQRTDRRTAKANLIEIVRSVLQDAYAPISVLINSAYQCQHYFGDTRKILSIGDGVADLTLFGLLPSDLRAPVRALVSRCESISGECALTVRRARIGDSIWDIQCVVRPVIDPLDDSPVYLVSFIPTENAEDPDYINAASSENGSDLLDSLRLELEDTRENLQLVIEDTETSNEELQALNEEMQANGEELQSANEEMQTANEELQSTNEELRTVNQELQVRTNELTAANSYMENVQKAIDLALVVVDKDMRILRYTPTLNRLFELLATDIGRPISTLKSLLDLTALEQNIRGVMENMRHYSEQISVGNATWLLRVNPYFEGNSFVSGAVVSFTEITELSDAKQDIAIRSAALSAAAPEGLVVVDIAAEDQPIVHATQAFCELTGYSRAEVLGRNCRFLQGEDSDPNSIAKMREAVEQKVKITVVLLNYRKDGSTFWNELRLAPVIESDGQVRYMVGIQSNISERKRAEMMIEHRANYDMLTGLANRNLLLRRLQRVLLADQKHGYPTFVLFVDLDGFKEINDTLGHATGDELLIQAAARLKSCVRETDTVARFGGDEFVIVVSDTSGLDAVVRIANNALECLREPFPLSQGTHRLSGSVGISASPQDATEAQALIQHADTAMYRAKTAGRDRFAFFQSSMNAEAVSRSAIKQEIFKGLDSGQFQLHYQPIIDLKSGAIVAAEALLRWQHPTNGMVQPADFISIAEETGQIVPLGNWVIEQAVKQLCNWQNNLSDDFRICINISAKQLGDRCLREVISDLPADVFSRLEFEVTESALVEKNGNVVENLALIRSRGARISLDDFGTGYSSLKFLLDFPVDTLKLDQGFLQTDFSQDKDVALLDAIFSLARGIGAEVVAEGVEKEEQLNFLKTKHCQFSQGFLFSEPLVPDAFIDLYISSRNIDSVAKPTAIH